MNGRSAKFSRQQPLVFSIALLGLLVLSGCGAPGEPQPPSPPIPAPISDLSAHQQGNGVQLVFTIPVRTVAGDRLAEPPAIEIYRGSLKPNGTPDNKSFKLVYTIPGELSHAYTAQEKIQFTDPLPPEELRANPGATYVYRVRTRASKKKDSADSNTVLAKVYPVPPRIMALDAHVMQSAIELSWTVPSSEPAGTAGETITGYRIYRGEPENTATLPSSADFLQVKWKSPIVLLAAAQANSYRDTLFDFGKAYMYLVRSVVTVDGNPIESDDSVPALVTPRDTFPPATPQNLIAAEIPDADGKPTVDLSWSISLESDLAGYRVYRSEEQGARGQPLNEELLLSPAYRDVSPQVGHRYWYAVIAVDRAGNESESSVPAVADLSQPSP